jgi:TonB family protein
MMLAIVASIFFCVASVCVSQTAATPANEKFEAGIKFIQTGHYSQAEETFKKLTRENGTDAESWYYLGVTYVQLKDFKKATIAFETSIKVKPDLAAAHTGLAYALLRRGKLIQASKEAEQALAIDPRRVDANYTLGVIALRVGLTESAIKHADKVIEQDPKFGDAYLLKSQALIGFTGFLTTSDNESKEERTNRFRQAAASLEKYLQLVPASPDKEVWQDQLDSLNFYSRNREAPGGETAHTGKTVTTKVRLLTKPEPQYTNEARNAQVEGTVVLRAVFASDGVVKRILVVRSLPNGLTEQAVRAAKKIKFIPATLDNKPVSMYMQLEYNFSLH